MECLKKDHCGWSTALTDQFHQIWSLETCENDLNMGVEDRWDMWWSQGCYNNLQLNLNLIYWNLGEFIGIQGICLFTIILTEAAPSPLTCKPQ